MVRATTILSFLVAGSRAVRAQSHTDAGTIPGAYIVEFDNNQNAATFRKQAGGEFDTRLELDFELFKGVSIQLPVNQSTEELAASFAALPSVKNIWPVRVVPPPRPEVRIVSQPDNQLAKRSQGNKTAEPYSTHVMTQVDQMHAAGITGNGIKIAIIDSGVDYKHPLLGGCFGQGCLVALGHDFVGDQYTGLNTPSPDSDPMDCMGHGTHVTGIISARENELGFKGAAPGASIAMYRVFGCDGGSADDILIAAFNRAYEEGADIISASIGSTHGWSSAPWAVAVSRIVERGVPCTLSAGNEGYDGLFHSQSAAIGKGVTSVASFQNTVIPMTLLESYYTIENGTRVPFPYMADDPDAFDNEARPLWVLGHNITDAADACEPLPDDTPDLGDYYVLVSRGDCEFRTQAENVAAKGGQYFIALDDEALTRRILNIWGVEGITAVGVVPQEIGHTWIKALQASSKITAEFINPKEAQPYIFTLPGDETQGAVSVLTSWGPSYEMEASPKIGAPGGNILSTHPLSKGGYAVYSGTSMACPFAAASFALIAEARGTMDPGLIERLLSATAKTQLFQVVKNGTIGFTDYLAPPVQQGAGLIQVYDAAYSTTIVEPSNLSFNDTANFAKTRNFTITNHGAKEIVYDISHIPTHSFFSLRTDGVTPNRYPAESLKEHAELLFSKATVSVKSGASVAIEVTAKPPQGLDSTRFPLWSGYIALNASDGTSFSLSYQGLSGSLYDAIVIDEDAAYIGDSFAGPLSPNDIYTLPRPGVILNPTQDPMLQVVINTNWGSSMITADLVHLTNTTSSRGCSKSIGQPAGFPIMWTSRGYWSTTWNGQLNTGEYAPAGRYKMVIKVLRIFGDRSNKKDWFVSETVPFQIRYDE